MEDQDTVDIEAITQDGVLITTTEEVIEGTDIAVPAEDLLISPNGSEPGLDFISFGEFQDAALSGAFNESIAVGVLVVLVSVVLMVFLNKGVVGMIGLWVGILTALVMPACTTDNTADEYLDHTVNLISEGYGLPAQAAEAIVFQTDEIPSLEKNNDMTSISEVGLQLNGEAVNVQVQLGLDNEGDLRVYSGDVGEGLAELPRWN